MSIFEKSNGSKMWLMSTFEKSNNQKIFFVSTFIDCYTYVDWVYVLPEYRHQGIAQGLFGELEKDCKAKGINQYYLIRATNHDADRFYHAFAEASLSEVPLLRKYL